MNCVTVIGAANVDIYGFSHNKLIPRTSNPGEIKTYMGGVARNVAENLVRFGIDTKLITVLGGDVYGRRILEHAKEIGINMDFSMIVDEERTSVYLAVIDSNRDMEGAVIDAKILEKLDRQFIADRENIIKNSRICFLDTNIPKDTISFILESNPAGLFFLDTVSCAKASRVVDIIGKFHSIKPNRFEAEILTGIQIKNKDDIVKASDILIEKGVKRVFISMGKDGVFYNDGSNKGFLKVANAKPVNVTGAGDAFTSSLAYCYLNNINIEDTARFAITASVITIEAEYAVNPNINVEAIYERMKGLVYV